MHLTRVAPSGRFPGVSHREGNQELRQTQNSLIIHPSCPGESQDAPGAGQGTGESGLGFLSKPVTPDGLQIETKQNKKFKGLDSQTILELEPS